MGQYIDHIRIKVSIYHRGEPIFQQPDMFDRSKRISTTYSDSTFGMPGDMVKIPPHTRVGYAAAISPQTWSGSAPPDHANFG